ncbi:MAG: hypothetical protein ACRDRG_13345 [Pseudonocardiaceae bacterium]
MTQLWNAVRSRRVLVIAVGVVLALGLGTSAAILGPELLAPDHGSKTTNAANTPQAANSAAPVKPAGFTDFRSEQAGFELSYPSTWSKLSPKDPQVLLLVAQGTQESFLIRASELPEPVGAEQVLAARQFTDQLVTSNKSVQLVAEPKQIELGGLPGLFYFYNFKDATSGQEGTHSHYFLFNGKTMISLVFQSLPKERFAESAKTFDDITATFRAVKV